MMSNSPDFFFFFFQTVQILNVFGGSNLCRSNETLPPSHLLFTLAETEDLTDSENRERADKGHGAEL